MNSHNDDQTQALLCTMGGKIKELQELHLQLRKTGHMNTDLLDAVSKGIVPIPKVASFRYSDNKPAHKLVGASLFSGTRGEGVVVRCKREGWTSKEEEDPFWTTNEVLVDYGSSMNHQRISGVEFTQPTVINCRLVYALKPLEYDGSIGPWTIESPEYRWSECSRESRLFEDRYVPRNDWNPLDEDPKRILLPLSGKPYFFKESYREEVLTHGESIIKGYLEYLATSSRQVMWVTNVAIAEDKERGLRKQQITLPNGDRIVAISTTDVADGFTVYWIRIPKF